MHKVAHLIPYFLFPYCGRGYPFVNFIPTRRIALTIVSAVMTEPLSVSTGGRVAVMAEEKKGPGPKTDAVRGAGGDTAHRAYKTAMWAVACLLFLLLVATLTALFLMWRYYRCVSPNVHVA